MISPSDVEMQTSIFHDPLAQWSNDDLLISQKSRDVLQAFQPELLRVLDWPELRESFLRHDGPAARGKRNSHRQGLIAITLAGFGVILIGVTPALPKATQVGFSAVALGFMSLGGVVGLLHWIVLRSKSVWLGHRFWTERLRQLYFQSLINNLQLTTAAMTDEAQFANLRKRRGVWLTELYTDPADPRDRLRAVIEDRQEANTWLRPEWKVPPALTDSLPMFSPLLEALYRQRIRVQSFYARKNLGSDVFSPTSRARFLRAVGDGSTVLVIIAAALGWITYLLRVPVLGGSALVWTAAAAVLSASSLVARAIDQGLQNEADADRYDWYADAVDELMKIYETADVAGRVTQLRRLEELSYEEMRRFLRTHNTARFMM